MVAEVQHNPKGLGFQPSKVEPDIWVRKKRDHYKYIARYVDDFAIASKEPERIIMKLVEEHNLKLKGTGPIVYHLGCNFSRDLVGVLRMCPRQCIDKVAAGYEQMFGQKPNVKYRSPLAGGDHPELDLSLIHI